MRDVIIEMTDGPAGYPAMMEGCPKMRRAGFFLRNAVNVDLTGVKVHGADAWLDADDSVRLDFPLHDR